MAEASTLSLTVGSAVTDGSLDMAVVHATFEDPIAIVDNVRELVFPWDSLFRPTLHYALICNYSLIIGNLDLMMWTTPLLHSTWHE